MQKFTFVIELELDSGDPTKWDWHILLDLKPTESVLVEPTQVICKFCGERVEESAAYFHQGGWVGECYWDDRLRTTE